MRLCDEVKSTSLLWLKLYTQTKRRTHFENIKSTLSLDCKWVDLTEWSKHLTKFIQLKYSKTKEWSLVGILSIILYLLWKSQYMKYSHYLFKIWATSIFWANNIVVYTHKLNVLLQPVWNWKWITNSSHIFTFW